MWIPLLGLAIIFGSFQTVHAAIPVQQAATEKKNRYVESGVFVGGFEHGPQVLLSMRRSYDKDTKIERIVLDLGPEQGSPTQNPGEKSEGFKAGRPGFFHVSYQKNPRRVLVDLHNVTTTKVDESKAKQILGKSHFFRLPRIIADSYTNDLTIELPLREEIKSRSKLPKVEVFELSSVGQPGRIVIDTKE